MTSPERSLHPASGNDGWTLLSALEFVAAERVNDFAAGGETNLVCGLVGIQVVRILWWVDPHLGGEVMRLRLPALEAVWVGQEGLVKGGLTSGMDGLCRAVVDAVWSHVADA